MPKVIIIEPNITKEENEKHWEEIKRVLDEIAEQIRMRNEA